MLTWLLQVIVMHARYIQTQILIVFLKPTQPTDDWTSKLCHDGVLAAHTKDGSRFTIVLDCESNKWLDIWYQAMVEIMSFYVHPGSKVCTAGNCIMTYLAKLREFRQVLSCKHVCTVAWLSTSDRWQKIAMCSHFHSPIFQNTRKVFLIRCIDVCMEGQGHKRRKT